MSTTGTISEQVPPSRSLGLKPVLATLVVAELLIWGSLRSGYWQTTGLGELFWAVHVALAAHVLLVPLVGWYCFRLSLKVLLGATLVFGAALDLLIWGSLYSGFCQRTGLGWLFWAVHVALAALVVLVPLGSWYWARHRFQLSLKALLASMLVIGAVCGSLAVFMDSSRRQREAAAALMARGIGIEYADEPGLHALIGVEFFESPVVLLGTSLQLDDADWNRVEQLTGLEWLACEGAADADLAHLRKLKELSSLHLVNARLTAEGLAILGELPRLTDLDLWRSKFTDGDLAALATCKRLTFLNLNKTAVGNAGLGHVSKLKTLQELGLDGTSITDDGLSQLKSLPALRRLSIRACPVSDEAIEQFTDKRPDVDVTH